MTGTCDICGGSIAERNMIGICSKTADCRTAYRRRWLLQSLPLRTNNSARRACEVCGGPITIGNRSAVCSRTPACRNEISVRWRAEHPKIHDDAYRRWWHRYHAKHRKARNAANQRCRARRQAERVTKETR